jgi:two-component system, response regulator PdtaR
MYKANLFIVEDETIIALNLKMQLESRDYNVLGIENSGEKAIEKLENLKPDLILMDKNLKGNLNGIETTEIIHQKYKIPILYITAYNDQITMDQIKESPAIGVINKPINMEELDNTIDNLLDKL